MINNRSIGDSAPSFIIAEACDNHMGDLDVAKEMCRLAKLAGCDCIKFQRHLPDEEMLKDVPMTANFDRKSICKGKRNRGLGNSTYR